MPACWVSPSTHSPSPWPAATAPFAASSGPGGAIAFITPTGWLDADYGAPVKSSSLNARTSNLERWPTPRSDQRRGGDADPERDHELDEGADPSFDFEIPFRESPSASQSCPRLGRV
jgi:hypothetical protein